MRRCGRAPGRCRRGVAQGGVKRGHCLRPQGDGCRQPRPSRWPRSRHRPRRRSTGGRWCRTGDRCRPRTIRVGRTAAPTRQRHAEQLERRIGRLEVVALVLELLERVDDIADRLAVKLDAERLAFISSVERPTISDTSRRRCRCRLPPDDVLVGVARPAQRRGAGLPCARTPSSPCATAAGRPRSSRARPHGGQPR